MTGRPSSHQEAQSSTYPAYLNMLTRSDQTYRHRQEPENREDPGSYTIWVVGHEFAG